MACPACFTPGPSPLLVNLSLETLANPQHMAGGGVGVGTGLAICSSRAEAWPGSSESQGSTLGSSLGP